MGAAIVGYMLMKATYLAIRKESKGDDEVFARIQRLIRLASVDCFASIQSWTDQVFTDEPCLAERPFLVKATAEVGARDDARVLGIAECPISCHRIGQGATSEGEATVVI